MLPCENLVRYRNPLFNSERMEPIVAEGDYLANP